MDKAPVFGTGDCGFESHRALAAWSRGMIPALGAGGPGLDSRSGPITQYDYLYFK